MNNMCSKCSIKQDCCRNLSGLRMSEIEYKQHFANNNDGLTVMQVGRLFLVSAKDGHSCPYWTGDQCSIYADRPMECRLFPYSLGKIIHIGSSVNISFHSRTECPDKEILLMSKADANKMIVSFSRQAFHDADKINIDYEWFYIRAKFKIMGLVMRWSKKIRSSIQSNYK
ncbi:MAG: YkgJ family cysteine cluster protein [Desulfobacterales bacterium]|nr:YkgJ family cysteine cluster protein [Desulfobacterales bacterium]